MVAVNDSGCVLAVDEYDLEGMHKAAQALNVALRVRSRCARVSVSKRGASPPLPSVSPIIAALAEEGASSTSLRAPTRFPSSLTSETPSEPKSCLAAAPSPRREAPPSLDASRRDRALRRPFLRGCDASRRHLRRYRAVVERTLPDQAAIIGSGVAAPRPRDEITRITPLPDPR